MLVKFSILASTESEIEVPKGTTLGTFREHLQNLGYQVPCSVECPGETLKEGACVRLLYRYEGTPVSDARRKQHERNEQLEQECRNKEEAERAAMEGTRQKPEHCCNCGKEDDELFERLVASLKELLDGRNVRIEITNN